MLVCVVVYDFILKSYFHSFSSVPQDIQSAHCENHAAGYSVSIVWEKPEGVWTAVEVDVRGETYTVPESDGQNLKIAGFQPAKTYVVSLTSLSGDTRSYKPLFFQCSTDPTGESKRLLYNTISVCFLM